MEWVCFGSTTFSALLPVYPNTDRLPRYLSEVSETASTENFYWASRIIDTLADPIFAAAIQMVERYQNAVAVKGRRLVLEYDRKMAGGDAPALIREANDRLCAMAKDESDSALTKILLEASRHMKNGYNLADN